jgi:hypothetical protein
VASQPPGLGGDQQKIYPLPLRVIRLRRRHLVISAFASSA